VREQSKNSPKRVTSLAARRKVAATKPKWWANRRAKQRAGKRLVPFVFHTAISRASLRD
jgi:hypothetical protein